MNIKIITFYILRIRDTIKDLKKRKHKNQKYQKLRVIVNYQA